MSLIAKKWSYDKANLLRPVKQKANIEDNILLAEYKKKDLVILYLRLDNERTCNYYDALIPMLKHANPEYLIEIKNFNDTTIFHDLKAMTCPSIVIMSSRCKTIIIKKSISITELLDIVEKNTQIRLSYV